MIGRIKLATLGLVTHLAVIWLVTAVWLATPLHADVEFKLENPDKGTYSIEASELLAVDSKTSKVSAEDLTAHLADAITDVPAWCMEGCRFPVSSIVRTLIVDIVDDDGTSHQFDTWTEIKEVISASYFSRYRVERMETQIKVAFWTPDADALTSLATPELPHNPLFFDQRGTWSFTQVRDQAGNLAAVRVDATLEMQSDKFFVNLMPSRVLAGTQDHLASKFKHLRDLITAEGSP